MQLTVQRSPTQRLPLAKAFEDGQIDWIQHDDRVFIHPKGRCVDPTPRQPAARNLKLDVVTACA
jgi:hypothetical protein